MSGVFVPPAPMKIGIDCRMYSPRFTGIGRYVFELTQNLFEIDKENEYVLFFNNPEFTNFTPPNKRVKKVLVNSGHYSLSEQTGYPWLLNKEKLDLMHFTHFNVPVLYNKPFIVTIHDLTLSYYPGKKMNNWFYRTAYHTVFKHAVQKSKKIVSVSNNTKQDLQKFYPTDTEKIEVIYEGVNKEFHPSKNTETTLKKYNIHKPYLLYTGVWRSHKNLPNLLKAFSILKNDYKFQGQLIITGRHDPLYANEIFNCAASLKLTNDTIFTGMVDEKELVDLYSAAEVYVFPSLYEGFGLPPLEAMQCGTPVATSNTSSMPEICGKENALFFNPEDPEDMAEKIFQIISEKSLREKLVENGLNHVKKFSWQDMTNRIFKIYQQK